MANVAPERTADTTPDVIQSDLRAFMAAVEEGQELAVVSGAHWDKEMGAVTEVLYRQKVDKSPMLVFDQIPGYPEQNRTLYGMFGSPLRLALALGMKPEASHDRAQMLDDFRKVIKRGFSEIPPKIVDEGPVTENVVKGEDLDLTELFPVPIHHELDGGRYIGTACGVVTKDPDTGRVNVGTYRVQVTGPNTCASYISNGKQGRIHRDKYLAAGKPCPVAIIVGADPITYLSAGYTFSDDVPEFDWCGGILGRPHELIEGEVTGMPFPSHSEIVLEGWIMPQETVHEGPFGEWHGYYAGETADEPLIRIERAYFRNDPILTCAASQKPPHAHLFERCFLRAAALLDSLEGAGIKGVKSAWSHQAGSGRTFVAVSVDQQYFGHSQQVGIVASQVNPVGYIGRWIIVVDDDIDPSDINDVIWAMGTRCDPKTMTTVLDRTWSSRLDTQVTDYSRLYNSRMVIDACIPYERRDTFPAVAQTSRELAAEVRGKYPELYR